MKILIVLTYYRPHTSGLTIYAERLARAMVKRGHGVTILTSQYEKNLPLEETQDGVRIIRVPVAFRLSKGVVMPYFGIKASRLVREHDVIQLHLPQFDAAGIALRGKLRRKPTVITYHCDLLMPPGPIPQLANLAVKIANNLAAIWTHRIVTYTQDYAENSEYLKRYLSKLKVIPPPVELPEVSKTEIGNFAKIHNPENHHPVIGMAARFATEKGVEVLLDAMPEILKKYPNALVQFAGPYQNIIGEEAYFNRLKNIVKNYVAENHWRYLGVLNPVEMAEFYPNIDLLVLPSLNSTEAFGLVQIEAMMNGVPCVASDLPGVRQPVIRHGMGSIIPIGDSKELADAVVNILADRTRPVVPSAKFKEIYDPESIAEEYESLFEEIRKEIKVD
jgi:glycosyltransferase involved in cell wall biosynthesis